MKSGHAFWQSCRRCLALTNSSFMQISLLPAQIHISVYFTTYFHLLSTLAMEMRSVAEKRATLSSLPSNQLANDPINIQPHPILRADFNHKFHFYILLLLLTLKLRHSQNKSKNFLFIELLAVTIINLTKILQTLC